MLQYSGKSANITLSCLKYIKAHWRSAEDCTLSVVGINEQYVVDKVECKKLAVLNCIKVYKKTMHKVGHGTDGTHASINFLK